MGCLEKLVLEAARRGTCSEGKVSLPSQAQALAGSRAHGAFVGHRCGTAMPAAATGLKLAGRRLKGTNAMSSDVFNQVPGA